MGYARQTEPRGRTAQFFKSVGVRRTREFNNTKADQRVFLAVQKRLGVPVNTRAGNCGKINKNSFSNSAVSRIHTLSHRIPWPGLYDTVFLSFISRFIPKPHASFPVPFVVASTPSLDRTIDQPSTTTTPSTCIHRAIGYVFNVRFPNRYSTFFVTRLAKRSPHHAF